MRKIFTLFVAALCCATMFAESGTCGENVNWDLTDGVLTISGTGPMENVSVYTQVPWRSYNSSITSVVIEEGVTTIGQFAFRSCAMTTISLPNTLVSIGFAAISKCKQLTSLTIPANVTTIGESAFNSSSALTEITCKAITPPSCGTGVFGNIDNTIPVKVPDESVSAYMSAAGWSVFTNIQGFSGGGGEAATSGSCGENLTWNFSGGVLTVSGIGIMTDYSDEGTPWYYHRASITSAIVENGVTTIGDYAFSNCAITEVSLPNTLTTIGEAAFNRCSALTSITLPNSVTTIGAYAFRSCGITEIALSNTLISIGNSAISLCKNLTAITIPGSVTSIENYAFQGTSALTEITCEATTPPTCGNYVFDGVDKSIPIYVPGGTKSAYKAAYGWKDFTNIIAPPEIYTEYDATNHTLTYYYDDQRAARTGVTELYKPSTVRFSGYYNQIEKAVIDPSMKNAPLSSMAKLFYGGYNATTWDIQALTALTEIEGLGNLNTAGVTDMNNMFFQCESLTDLDLSTFNTSNVTNMNSMFIACKKLQTIDLTSFDITKVTDMRYMFNNCPALTTIYCNNDWSSTTAQSDGMFSLCSSLVGGNGTPYSSSHVDASYARPDEGSESDKPGYFSTKSTTGIEYIATPSDKARKVMMDGTLYIAMPDGKIYNANGVQVK